MIIEGDLIIAEEGKVLRRIRDKVIFGNRLKIGYTHYLCNTLLKVPVMEYPRDYEEIDIEDEEVISIEENE